MWFFLYQDHQIPGATSAFSHISFSTHTELHSLLHSGRYFQRYHFLSIYSSFAFTYRALIGDHRSFTITIRTGSYRLHLAKESILNAANLAVSTTGSAGLGTVFIFSARATTIVAGNIFLYFYSFAGSLCYFFIIYFYSYS